MMLTDYRMNGNHMTARSWITLINVVHFFGLVFMLTPASALTHLYTDGQIHVSWRVANFGNQSDADDTGNGQSEISNEGPPPFPENVEFCEFGERGLDEAVAGVMVFNASTDTVVEYVKACERFVLAEDARRKTLRGRRRQKRAYDFKVIYPGTKWCGSGNKASSYDDLGRHSKVDSCCREHDHCPDYIRNGKQRNGLRNHRGYTLLSCSCDETFRQCLYAINNFHSNTIGFTYFNLLRNECFAPNPKQATGPQLELFASKPYIPCFSSGFFSRIFNKRNC